MVHQNPTGTPVVSDVASDTTGASGITGAAKLVRRGSFWVALISIAAILLTSSFRNSSSSSSLIVADSLDASTDSILKSWLKKQVVNDNQPVSKIFWFWTTAAELDAVQKERMLLRRFPNGNAFDKQYREKLEDKKWKDHPLAQILRGSNFGRFEEAWPCYWEAATGIRDTSSDQLVKVELEDSALIVVFHPARKKDNWEVYDVSGNEILLPEALKRQNNIAAIYFSDDIHLTKFKYTERRFFLCNESMIRTWSHDVPGVQNEINKDVAYLLLLHAWFKSDPEKKCLSAGKAGRNTKRAWTTDDPQQIAELTMQTFCFSFVNADDAMAKMAVDFVRNRWPAQKNPMQKFPSRGVR